MAIIIVYHLTQHLGTVSVNKSKPSVTLSDPNQIMGIYLYMKPLHQPLNLSGNQSGPKCFVDAICLLLAG